MTSSSKGSDMNEHTPSHSYNCEDPCLSYANSIGSGSSLTLVESQNSTFEKTHSEVHEDRHVMERLPDYLWKTITTDLDVVSIVCFGATNRYLHTTIIVDRTNLTKCESWLIHRRFRKDMRTRSATLACILCILTDKKNRFSTEQLRCVTEHNASLGNLCPRTLRGLFWIQGGCSQDPDHGIDLDQKHLYQSGGRRPRCYAHLMAQFGSDRATEPLLPFIIIPTDRPSWIKFTVLRCLHCGSGIEGDTRLEGCLKCLCNVCPRNPDYQIYRTGPRRSLYPQVNRIFSDAETNSIWVGEAGSEEVVQIVDPTSRGGGVHLQSKYIYYVAHPRFASKDDWMGWTQRRAPE